MDGANLGTEPIEEKNMTLEEARKFKGHYNPDVAELARLAEERLLLENLCKYSGLEILNTEAGSKNLGEAIRKTAGVSDV